MDPGGSKRKVTTFGQPLSVPTAGPTDWELFGLECMAIFEDRMPRFLALANSPIANWADVFFTSGEFESATADEKLRHAIRTGRGPTYMPYLAASRTDEAAKRYGRPRAEHSRFAQCVQAAWYCDLNGGTAYAVTRLLDGAVSDAGRKRRMREIHGGREVLASLGVLPWVAWPGGKLPQNWWTSERFRTAVQSWIAETSDAIASSKSGWTTFWAPSGTPRFRPPMPRGAGKGTPSGSHALGINVPPRLTRRGLGPRALRVTELPARER